MLNKNHIKIIDALKGFALIVIIMVSCVEHFDFFKETQTNFIFSNPTNNQIIQSVFFLFSEIAWSIFALVFGYSFYIQIHQKEKNGSDFKLRFVWRLTILIFIGFINSLVYKGDAVQIIAVCGLFIVAIYRLSSKTLILITILLAFQIPTIIDLVLSFIQKDFQYVQLANENLWREANNIYSHGSFFDMLEFNLWKGRLINWNLIFYTGQYLQILAFLVSGILLGKIKFFEELQKRSGLLLKILIMGVLLVSLFVFMIKSILISEFSEIQKLLITILINSWLNITFTMVLILGFILFFIRYQNLKVFDYLDRYGQMSLSNYVFMSICGVIFYYGFGFSLFNFMNTGLSLIFGFIIFSIQMVYSKIWLNNFYYGPLEWLWRAFTLFNFSLKFRKEKETDITALI